MLVDDLTAGGPGYASTLRGGPQAPGPGLAQFQIQDLLTWIWDQ